MESPLAVFMSISGCAQPEPPSADAARRAPAGLNAAASPVGAAGSAQGLRRGANDALLAGFDLLRWDLVPPAEPAVLPSGRMSLQSDIQDLVAKFAADLESRVRSAAVSAVQSALGGSNGASSALPAAAGRKRGPKPKTAAPASAAAPAAAKSRKGKRVRRTAAQIEATANKIHAFVKANPNSNAEAIKKGIAIAKNEWLAPLSLLMEGKRLASKGQKRDSLHGSLMPKVPALLAERETESGVESAAPVGNRGNRAGSVLVLLNGLGRAVTPVVHRRLEKRCALFHTHHTADCDHF